MPLSCTVNEVVSLISHKKLRYCRGTARLATLFNPCYASQGMAVRSTSRDWGLEYNGGLGLCPQRGPGAEPLIRGSGGKAPWSWTFCHMPLKLSLLGGSRPKFLRASPNNVLRVLQISSKSVHFRRSYSRTRQHRQIAKSSIRPKLNFQSNNQVSLFRSLKCRRYFIVG